MKSILLPIAASLLLTAGCSEQSEKPAAAATAATAAGTKPKPYTLDTCVVSGEKLGGMGDPVVFVYKGQEIKLCCKSCRGDFDKDPAKYLAKLAAK